MAAETCTPEAVNFMVTHGRGIVCLPVRGVAPRRARHPADGDRHHRRPRGGVHGLDRLPARHDHGHERARPGHHREGRDRPRDVEPHDFQKPGHVFPLRAKEGGVLAPRRPHRGGRRPRRLAGHVPGGRDLRGHERGRHDGAPARAHPGRARARHEADLDRRPDRVPAPPRGAGGARRRGHDPHAATASSAPSPTRAWSTAAPTSRS